MHTCKWSPTSLTWYDCCDLGWLCALDSSICRAVLRYRLQCWHCHCLRTPLSCLFRYTLCLVLNSTLCGICPFQHFLIYFLLIQCLPCVWCICFIGKTFSRWWGHICSCYWRGCCCSCGGLAFCKKEMSRILKKYKIHVGGYAMPGSLNIGVIQVLQPRTDSNCTSLLWSVLASDSLYSMSHLSHSKFPLSNESFH